MLLKTVHQWDIRNQEDLDIFSAESLEIHQSATRTLYRTNPEANPAQYAEEVPEVDNSQRRDKKTGGGDGGTTRETGKQEETEAAIPIEEEKQEPDEKLWKLWIMMSSQGGRNF